MMAAGERAAGRGSNETTNLSVFLLACFAAHNLLLRPKVCTLPVLWSNLGLLGIHRRTDPAESRVLRWYWPETVHLVNLIHWFICHLSEMGVTLFYCTTVLERLFSSQMKARKMRTEHPHLNYYYSYSLFYLFIYFKLRPLKNWITTWPSNYLASFFIKLTITADLDPNKHPCNRASSNDSQCDISTSHGH